MIYNLFQYLKTLFVLLRFIVDGWENDDPQESILITQTGGDPAHWYDRQDFTVQVLVRSESKSIAYKNSHVVYNELFNRFGLVLPEATVESIVYPALETAQIIPVSIPGYIGTDQNKLHMYSTNFKITIGG